MAISAVKTALKDLHYLKGTGLVVAARAQGPSEKTKAVRALRVALSAAAQEVESDEELLGPRPLRRGRPGCVM